MAGEMGEMVGNAGPVPRGWTVASLNEIAQINPAANWCVIHDDIEVPFVPMRAVEGEGGGLLRPESRRYHEVKKGYTSFISGDVIMAKITPCMENGNQHFTLKQKPIQRSDFDEFVECYKPARLHERKETWSADNPEGRWRCFDHDELLKRDKLSLDLFWIKDKSLTDTDSLPAPDVIAAEIADDLEAALNQFTKIAARLRVTK